MTERRAILAALAAAALFGASAPFAKQLVGDVPPVLLAGLLYLGSGLGLAVLRLARDRGWQPPRLPANEWGWLAAAIAFGGIAGPVLLMLGLARTSASSASLLLNLEAVLTALLAWIVFRENAGPRIVFGMLLIVAGGVCVAWPSPSAPGGLAAGPMLIAGACLCWAIDNNLTRKVSASDALLIAGTKGIVAGTVNTALAMSAGALWPPGSRVASAMLVGFAGYGVSLALFVVALRGLGTGRTGAYFSTAPFFGAALAITVFGEPAPGAFWLAAFLMACGVVLHLTEHHEHSHTHIIGEHEHPHVHDEHHRHAHEFEWDGKEPHSHSHRHEPLRHSHAHVPDIHHRHEH